MELIGIRRQELIGINRKEELIESLGVLCVALARAAGQCVNEFNAQDFASIFHRFLFRVNKGGSEERNLKHILVNKTRTKFQYVKSVSYLLFPVLPLVGEFNKPTKPFPPQIAINKTTKPY